MRDTNLCLLPEKMPVKHDPKLVVMVVLVSEAAAAAIYLCIRTHLMMDFYCSARYSLNQDTDVEIQRTASAPWSCVSGRPAGSCGTRPLPSPSTAAVTGACCGGWEASSECGL